MRFQFSIRFLCVAITVCAVAALGIRFWMNRTTFDDIADQLNDAHAQPHVWDHWNAESFIEDRVQVQHLNGEYPCVGLTFDRLDSRDALVAAANVTTVTEIVILEIDPSLSVAGCDFTHLKELYLGNPSQKQLSQWLKVTGELERLSLSWNDPDSMLDFSEIARMDSLETLRFSDMHLSGRDLDVLRSLPNLDFISFYDCTLDDSTFETLGQFPALTGLQLDGTTVDDDTFRLLRNVTNIDSLSVTSSNITDRDVQTISKMDHLSDLSLYGCQQITSECVPYLMEMKFLDWLDVLATPIEEDPVLKGNPPAMLMEWVM